MKIILKPISVQVAVIFGASSGIGRLTALEMAKRGAKICVAARSIGGLKTLVEEIEFNGGEAFFVEADAADFEQVKSVADKCVARYGRIDTWIHSAAAFLFASVENSDPDEYKRLIEVNLLGHIYGAKAALPYLKEHGGALIHVTSVEARRTAPYQSAYGASKHGIHGFLQVLRVELAHDRIPVSVTEILPAAINTPIYEKGRNKMPFKMRPVPPIYHPQIVVDTILYAAENPVRDMVAGGAGLGVIYTERISPKVADFFSETIGFIGQNGGEIDAANQFKDNLFAPVSGFDTVEGNFSGEQFSVDPYTSLITSPRAKNFLTFGAIGLIGGFLALRIFRNKKGLDSKSNTHKLSKSGGNMNSKTSNLLDQANVDKAHSSFSTAEKTFNDRKTAGEVYALLKTQLLNVDQWNEHSMMSSYRLFDENGQNQETTQLQVGLFMQISLKGSMKYDWIRIQDIHESSDEFIISVKPTYDPTTVPIDSTIVSHFFTDESTNNFCLKINADTVSLSVIGINEKQNTAETKNPFETVRNVAVNLSTYLGLQNAEWEKFCHDFLEDAAQEKIV